MPTTSRTEELLMGTPAVTAYRVLLGLLLRNYRERSGLTPTELAKRLKWYGVGKASKVEAGAVRLAEHELDVLMEMYDVSGAEAEKVREFGAEARKRPQTGRVPAWKDTYEVFEAHASEIKSYSESVLPGALQTDDYARALLSMSLTIPPADVARHARERSQRQELLTADTPPAFWLVVSESLLYRPVGGPEVFRAQLVRLRELAELPHVTVQVLPQERGEHVALGSPFTIVHLALPPFTVAYLEGLTDANYLDREEEIKVYRLAFDRLRVTALDDRASAALLDRRIEEMA
jgi:hypothetical protein